MPVLALERVVEEKVCKWAKTQGILPLKLNLMANTGWPDRMFLYAGRVVFIEFKRVGEKLRRNQPERVATLRGLGFAVGVFDNVAESVAFLEAEILSKGRS
jgi:hypothetical protein